MSKVDAIKSQYEIRATYERLSGDELNSNNQASCLYCDSSDAFTLYEDSFYCYSCCKHGDVIDILAWGKKQSVGDFLRGNKLELTPEEIEFYRAQNAERERVREEERTRNHKNAVERLHSTQKWIEYHNNLNETYRELWRRRGVEDAFQSIWQLGYNPAFKYRTNQGILTTPSLTIPIKAVGGECLNIQHRLQNAINGERYRPEGMGLKMDNPFICDTELKGAQDIIIVEGAIKAMVTYQTYDKPGAQVIGALNKGMMDKTIRQSKGRNAIVIPDPDGREEIQDAARCSGAKVLRLPKKIDDLILEHGLGKHWLRDTIQQARII